MPIQYDAVRFEARMAEIADSFHRLGFLASAAIQTRSKSMKIDDVSALSTLTEGEVILVKQIDSDEKIAWTSLGGGVFGFDGAQIPYMGFASAVHNGNVFAPQPPLKVGDFFATPSSYCLVMATEGGQFVVAHGGTGSSYVDKFHYEVVAEAGAAWVPRQKEDYTGTRQQIGYNLMLRLYRAERDQARLAQVIESGEVPAEVEYAVQVEVTAGRREPGKTEMVTVTKRSRWGCACDLVMDADIGTKYMRSWRVVGCAPSAEDKKSKHTAA